MAYNGSRKRESPLTPLRRKAPHKMATLNGFKITCMTSWTGREGIGTSGKLYANGKLLGEFVDYGDGGAINFRFPERKLDEAIREQLPEIGSLEMLVCRLADMTETEKWLRGGYRKATKAGKRFVSATDGNGNIMSCAYDASVSPRVAEFSLREDARRRGFDADTTTATAWDKTPTLDEGDPIDCAEALGQVAAYNEKLAELSAARA